MTLNSRCQHETAFGTSSCYSHTLNGIKGEAFALGMTKSGTKGGEKKNIHHTFKCAFLCLKSNSQTWRHLDCVVASVEFPIKSFKYEKSTSSE